MSSEGSVCSSLQEHGANVFRLALVLLVVISRDQRLGRCNDARQLLARIQAQRGFHRDFASQDREAVDSAGEFAGGNRLVGIRNAVRAKHNDLACRPAALTASTTPSAMPSLLQ